ncbi:hypothetical protein GCM10010253_65210 [Streptomyces badius]|uniref:Uncharacterized protein n=1 Tax=Streptomyces badius TaxID=1941 RepID=A0ABQ2TRX5_STRBA|nr:hypothetical protein GCM10010253_65210 [Streptomyces badius]
MTDWDTNPSGVDTRRPLEHRVVGSEPGPVARTLPGRFRHVEGHQAALSPGTTAAEHQTPPCPGPGGDGVMTPVFGTEPPGDPEGAPNHR